MFVILVLILSISSGLGEIPKGVPYLEHQPQQWQDLVVFVNQKISHLERSLNIKDRDIHKLESRIQHQDIEIMQLKQDVVSLKQVIRHTVVNGQAKQVLDSNADAFNNFKEIDSSNHVLSSSETAHGAEFNKNSSINSSTKGSGVMNTQKDISNVTPVGVDIHHPFPERDDIHNARVDPPGSIPSRDGYGLNLASDDVTGEFPHQYADSRDANTYTRNGSKQKRVVPEQAIAFHAFLSNSVDARVHATVIFDHEQLDQGAGYNPLDGIYRVPESGTYVITWTLVADRHAEFKTELIVNGVALGNSWTDADEVGDLHQTSATTVLTLNQGDRVFVRVGDLGRGKISTEVSNPTFSGVAPSTPRQQVAFHAYRTSTVTLGTQATFIFNHETLDQGDGYNPGDGLYTVPESGTYVITWTMLSFYNNAFQYQLVVNGVVRGMSWTDSDEINDIHQTTGIVVLTLKQGDHMFIRMGHIILGTVYSYSANAQPTFSGWKLD